MMGVQIQVKCRRCRTFLLSEESIINQDGCAVQDTQTGWDGGSSSGPTKTHLFVSSELSPSWILDAIVQSSYTQGKILCPKCEGRVGSFSFVKPTGRCANRQKSQPPIHLLQDRVDVTNTSDGHRLTVPVVDCRLAAARNTGKADSVNEDSANRTSLQERLPREHCSCESCSDDADQMLHLDWLFGERSSSSDSAVEPCMISTDCINDNTQADFLNTAAERADGGDAFRSCTCRAASRLQDSSSGCTGIGDSTPAVHKSRRQSRRELRNREMESLQGDLCRLNAIRGNSQWWNSFTALCNQGTRKKLQRRNRKEKVTESHSAPEKETAEKKDLEEQMLQAEEVLWEHTCPMCMEVMLVPHTVWPCQHHFCELCLRRLGSIHTPATTDCPLCRQRITKCVKNKEMDKAISIQSPAHLAVRRREEKKHRRGNHNFMKLPLPSASRFPAMARSLPMPARLQNMRWPNYAMMVYIVMFVLVVLFFLTLCVMSLAYIGMGLCRLVLGFAARLFDGVMVLLTGEKLWSEFMGVESRVATVSSVFVLYLVCSLIVNRLHAFRGILYQ